MSGRPLVPSKDALRALRHLALSSPAAYFGTAGALCGVATLHYHARCKVRLAEKIVERKRALHSISNGKGAARVALMFEAAEHGDDFTLKNSKAWGTSGKRQYSAAVSQKETEYEGPLQDDGLGFEGQDYEVERDNSKTQSSALRRLYEASREPYRVSRRRTDVSEVNVWDTFVKHARVSRAQSKSNPRKFKRSRPRPTSMKTKALQPRPEPTEVYAAQPASDLNPLHATEQTLDAEAHDVSDPDPLNLDAFYHSGVNIFSAMKPWQNIEEGQDILTQKSDALPDADVDFYIPFGQAPPKTIERSDISSRYNTKVYRVRQSIKIIGSERYDYTFNALMNFGRTHGRAKAVAQLERTMRLYIATGRREDWAFAQALFLDCVLIFTSSELKPMIWRLVRGFLHGDTPRLEVVGLLYPQCGAGAIKRSQYFFYLAHQYVQDLVERVPDFDELVSELRKLLAGTQSCGFPLEEHLVVPVLRWLCAAGRMTQAQAVYDEMESVYKINFSFYATQWLVKGYAGVDNWSQVKMILDAGHQKNLSHRRVYGFGTLLTSIIHQFTSRSSPEKTYEFVVHCIDTYGVQPISPLSRKMVTLALRHRRYDLVSAWINMILTKYPHIDTGTGSGTFAYDVSCVWRDMDATCEDVYLSCRAIATHALRDPFSTNFRAIAAGAVANYFDRRLRKLRKDLGLDASPDYQNYTADLQEVLSVLERNAYTGEPGNRAKLLLSDLLSQAKALLALKALFRGEIQSEDHLSQATGSRDSLSRTSSLDLESLPGIDQVTTSLLARYVEREKRGLPIEHQSLRHAVALLVHRNRRFHAFQLIETIYESRWASAPTGCEFDFDLFADWIEVAWRLASGSKLRSVLWALVESGPHIKFDSHLNLLARVAAPKTHFGKVKHARPNEIEEIEYLRSRIKMRQKHQGRSRNMRFGVWKGFSRLAEHEYQ